MGCCAGWDVRLVACAPGLWASSACGLCRLRRCTRLLLDGGGGGVHGLRGVLIGGF